MPEAILFTTVLVALGVLLWVLAWRDWRKRAAMRHWPTATASIHGYRTRLRRHSRMVDVEVSYRHEGRDYRAWCVSPTRSGYGRGAVQAELQVATIFPVGSAHPVFVNPGRADEAFLELPEAHMLPILVGAGLILLSVAATAVLQVTSALDPELAVLLFMVLLGVVLSVIVVFMGVALARTPRPRRR